MPALGVERRSSLINPLHRTGLSGFVLSIALTGAIALLVANTDVPGSVQFAHRLRQEVVTLSGFETKGGLVNLVEGDVRISKQGNLEVATVRGQVTSGEMVVTGAQSRAEILLNPGYYLRMGPDTACKLAHLSLDDQRLEVVRGAVIVEIVDRMKPVFYDPHTLLTVATPFGEVSFPAAGVLLVRVSATNSDVTTVKGKAVVGKRTLPQGNKAVFEAGGGVTTSTQLADDELVKWSVARAAVHARLNAGVANEDWYKQTKGRSFLSMNQTPQNHQDLYTASASSAQVRLAEDGVTVSRGGSEGEPLKPGSQLQAGDLLRTGSGRAELSLSPGVYVRLSSQTEIKYSRPNSRRYVLEISRGSMVIETIRPESIAGLEVVVTAAQAESVVRQVGHYRMNATENEFEVLVREGRISAGKTEFGRGKRVVCTGEACRAESFDKRETDGFDLWSARRSENNVGLDRSGWQNPNMASPGRIAVGLWYYLGAAQSYTFVPLYWDGRSPYGDRYPIRLDPHGSRPPVRQAPRPPTTPGKPY
jgi:hypothetical protein